MQITEKMKKYWVENQIITAVLLLIWFVFTFVMIPLAPWLNQFKFLGFPLGFYMGAQGTLLVYVLIIIFYAWFMNNLDKKYGVSEE